MSKRCSLTVFSRRVISEEEHILFSAQGHLLVIQSASPFCAAEYVTALYNSGLSCKKNANNRKVSCENEFDG